MQRAAIPGPSLTLDYGWGGCFETKAMEHPQKQVLHLFPKKLAGGAAVPAPTIVGIAPDPSTMPVVVAITITVATHKVHLPS